MKNGNLSEKFTVQLTRDELSDICDLLVSSISSEADVEEEKGVAVVVAKWREISPRFASERVEEPRTDGDPNGVDPRLLRECFDMEADLLERLHRLLPVEVAPGAKAKPANTAPKFAEPVAVNMTVRQREYLQEISWASRYSESELLLSLAFARLDIDNDGPWINDIYAAALDFCEKGNLPKRFEADDLTDMAYGRSPDEAEVVAAVAAT